MPPQDERRFGSAARGSFPTEEEVVRRISRPQGPSFFSNPIPSVSDLEGTDISRFKPPAIVEFADDPEEIRLKQQEQRIQRRVEQMQLDLVSEKPAYQRAFGLNEAEEPMGFFNRAWTTASFGYQNWKRREDIIEEELGFIDEEKRRVRNTLRFGEFILSLGQDVAKAFTGGVVAGFYQAGNNSLRMATGEETKDVRWQSDSFWWKLLYGRETERDIYGRVIPGSSKGREVRSVTALQKDYEASLKDFQSIAPEDREFRDNVMPIMVSTFGAPAMMLLEMDIGILPIATVNKFVKGGVAARNTSKGILQGMETIITSAGRTFDGAILKEAREVAKEVLKNRNPLEAQRTLNDFLLRTVGPESAEGQAIQGIEATVNAEIAAARTELDQLAINSPDLPTFTRLVEESIRADRATQARAVSSALSRTVNDPAFLEATQRVEEIFTEFGTGLADEDILRGQLVPETPDAVRDEFESLVTNLQDINDNTINRLTNQLTALSDAVPIGTGAFDVTRNLLRDQDTTLPGLLEDVFRQQQGRFTSSAADAIGSLDNVTSGQVSDALQRVNRQLAQFRISNRRGATAAQRLSDYLNAEDIARGVVARRALLAADDVVDTAVDAVPTPASRVEAPAERPAPTPVNDNVFENAELSVGDSLLAAADDVLAADSLDDFIKNSDEVVYQGESGRQFVPDEDISRQLNPDMEINPPVVLNMRRPLRADAEGYDLISELMPEMAGRSGLQLTPAEAKSVLDEAQRLGYDGIIYSRRLGDESFQEERLVVSSKQVIPAQFFYDNIKGGKEVFGEGIDLALRRQQQGDDILEKMLPKNKAYNEYTKMMKDSGLPTDMAERASRELHAFLLDRYTRALSKAPRFVTQREISIRGENGGFAFVAVGRDGIRYAHNYTDTGESVVGNIANRQEMADLYKKTAEAFDKDAAERVKNLANVQVAGSITEAKFIAKGPGHKRFNDGLKKRVQEGVLLPEELLVIRGAFKDMDDSLLKRIPPLESSAAYVDNYKNGTYNTATNKITMARGLAYQGMRRERRGSRRNDNIEVGRLGSETFFHEFGHLGHRILLSPQQKRTVTEVYKSLSRADLRRIFRRDAGRIGMENYYAKNEDEFFAQAFSQYALRNQLADERLLPLFERITQQLKASLGNLFRSKQNAENGKIDALIPMFDQILKGQSAARNATGRKLNSKKGRAEVLDDASRPPRTSMDPDDYVPRQRPIKLSREGIEQNLKILQSTPGGIDLPEDVRKQALGVSRAMMATNNTGGGQPPKTPKEIFQRGADPDKYYDAKVIKGINKIDPKDPKLAAALEPQKVFGKNTQVPKGLRQGQKQLQSAMSKIQKKLVAQDERFVKAVETLKASREAAIKRANLRFATAEAVRKEVADAMKREAEALAEFGTAFTANQSKQIANLVSKTRTNKQLQKALTRISDMADDQLRIEARARIGKIKEDVKKGTRNIPPRWQEKIEERLAETIISLKVFKEDYVKRLEGLQKFLDENPEEKLKFKSPKTIRMLRDLEELEKRSVNDFDTDDLVKLTHDLEQIYEEGEAAQFVLKGGKTKKITRPVVKVDPSTGKITTEQFVVQEGGIPVMGLEELRIKADVAEIEEAAEKGLVSNLDKGEVVEKFGDLEATTFKGVWDGLKNLASTNKDKRKNSWQRGLMTYLTSDRVIDLMDKMAPNGPVYQKMLKPLRDSVNRGENAGNRAQTRFLNKEKEIIKKYKLSFGQTEGAVSQSLAARGVSKIINSGFTDANYERIAIWAYHQQGLDDRLVNLVPRADIDAVIKGGLKPYEKEMYEFMRKELDELYPKVDETMREVHGTRVERIEKYFPIQTNVLDSRTMEEVLNIEYIPNKRAVARGFTKDRYDLANNLIRMNARDIYMKHMRDVNYFVEVEPTMKQMAGMQRDENFIKTLGKNSSLWWESYLDIVARRGTPKNYDFNWSDVARKNLGAWILALNPSPVLKQWLAGFAGLGYLGPKHTLINGHRLMVQEKLFDAIGEVSIEQALRAADDPVFAELRASGKVQEMQDMGYWAIKKTDAWTARGIWLAAYSKQLEKKGKLLDIDNFKNGIGIDQEALDYADMVVRKTQGSGKFQDLPQMLTNKNKRGFTFLFQFQSFVLSQSQLLTHDAFYSAYASARGISDQKFTDVAGRAVSITAAITAATAIEQEITKGLTNLYGSENAKKWQEENSDVGSRLKQGMYSAFPPVGSAMGFIDGDMNTNVPMIDALLRGGVSFSRAVGADTDTLQGRETQAKEALRVIGTAIGLRFGIPGGSFTQQIIQNKGIEPAFRSPAENLKYAYLAGDREEFRLLLQDYQDQGLDLNELEDKVERMIESELRRERKKDVDIIVERVLDADTAEERNEIRREVRELLENGTFTQEHIKDIESELRKEGRLEALGEN